MGNRANSRKNAASSQHPTVHPRTSPASERHRMRPTRPNGIRSVSNVVLIRPRADLPVLRTCRHCYDQFVPAPGKPGYIDECPSCMESGPPVDTPRIPVVLPSQLPVAPAMSVTWHTTHVVSRDSAILRAVAEGLWCRLCRSPFQARLWPHEEMVVECRCFCVCHRS